MSSNDTSKKSSEERPKRKSIRDLGLCLVTWDMATDTFYVRGRDGYIAHKERTAQVIITSHWGDGGEFRGLVVAPPIEREVTDEMLRDGEDCGFVGCGRPRFTKGYCRSHNAQRDRYGEVWPIGKSRGRPKVIREEPPLKVLPEAPKILGDNGVHYIPGDKCYFPGCDRPRKFYKSATRRGGRNKLCPGHEKQWSRHRELKPLKGGRRRNEEVAYVPGLLPGTVRGPGEEPPRLEQPEDCPGA